MDQATAVERLRSMVAADQTPVLAEDDLIRILDEAAIADIAGNPTVNTAGVASWMASTAVVPGEVITEGGRFWRCIVGGTTDATEPTWPDLGGTARGEQVVVDGTVRWSDNGTAWAGRWDMQRAAMIGWERKAAAAAALYDFQADDQRFSRAQVAASCRAQAAWYRARLASSTVTR